MNKIEAIIRPEKLTSGKDALAEAGPVGLIAAPVAGSGNQRGVVVGGTSKFGQPCGGLAIQSKAGAGGQRRGHPADG